MNASSRGSANWPFLVAVSLIGLSAASCSSDSGRFGEGFGSNNSRAETTGSISQSSPTAHIQSQPLPRLASADNGSSGGGRGMGSYEPEGEVTGSLPAPQPTYTWQGGTPIVVAPGETLETISRRHGVPVSAIMQANNIANPTAVHPGQHLVIPRLKNGVAYAQPPRAATPAAVMPPVGPVGAPRTALAPSSGVHVVAPGETLHSIARLYSKPVMVLAKANNFPPDTMVRVGQRIVIPNVQPAQQASLSPPHTQPPAAVPAVPAHGPDYASAESPHSARVASPEPAPATEQTSTVKSAEPAGGLPSFRWPARGRVIAGFGPSPNGLQNDGINVAVPEGTPIKAAEDGVVAYAGNELKGYGNLVLVRHSNGFVTAYAHASEILVKRGEAVKRGQVIAKSGQTGNVTSPQLHFEIRKGSTPVDPSQYLNGA